MSADLFGTSPTHSEHDVTLTLHGSEESLRQRLIDAVERLNYKMIGEQPLQARRAAQCSARWGCSFEILDYPRRLTVSLKQINEVATLATFSYEIKAYSGLTRGDRRTLDCEARALAAIATQRDAAVTCTACGTKVTDESRFCRRCGALIVVEVAELEVLRLMEDTRRGYHNVTMGVILSLIALLIPLLLIWFDSSKAFRVVTILSSIGGVLGAVALIRGMRELHRSLNQTGPNTTTVESSRTFAAPQTAALPPRSAQSYVTEGTTELLFPEEEERERVPVERKAVDTAEVR